jgi:hexulose-6-phosphate isomerase
MKKGISIWAFPSGLDVVSCIRMAKETGFDGIELALNESGQLGLDSSEDELRGYRQAADLAGIEITSLATGLYWKYSLTASDETIREKAKGVVRKQLDAASILGVDAILVVPGTVGADFVSGSEVIPYDIAYDRSLSALRELAPHAALRKVRIGVENVWNKFLLSPLEMRGFIDSIDSPWAGAYFDVGNVLSTGYPEQWIAILGKRICRVHVKDFRKSVGTLDGFVDLLSGDVDFPEVMKALEKIGYDGWMTAEVFPYGRNPEMTAWQASKAMDAILGRNAR